VIKRIDKAPVLILAIAMWLSSAFTIAGAKPTRLPSCLEGAPQCPIKITFPDGAAPVVVQGRLSPRRSSYSYQFSGALGGSLSWTYAGPAVNVLLTDPDGTTDGPGLPAEVLVNKDGDYVFSVSSNKMAENVYGEFSLSLKMSMQK